MVTPELRSRGTSALCRVGKLHFASSRKATLGILVERAIHTTAWSNYAVKYLAWPYGFHGNQPIRTDFSTSTPVITNREQTQGQRVTRLA
jgi:hypothetical protein